MSSRSWLSAFAVHVLTASGAAFALLALLAGVDRAWSAMFLWLGIALIVDAIDGPLARRFSVATVLPRWSGETLDLVVDFLTYVFVPAYAIARAGVLPDVLATPAGIAIAVSGAIYFADRKMKMDENYFRGFPALWNAAAFYVILLAPAPWLAAAFVAALLVMSFLPFPFIHPLRVKRLRALNITVLIVWAILALVALACDMSPGPWVDAGLCLIAAYVLVVGLLRLRT